MDRGDGCCVDDDDDDDAVEYCNEERGKKNCSNLKKSQQLQSLLTCDIDNFGP